MFNIVIRIDNIVEVLGTINIDVSFSKGTSSGSLDETFIEEVRHVKSKHLEANQTTNQGSSADIEVPISPHVSKDGSINTSENVL